MRYLRRERFKSFHAHCRHTRDSFSFLLLHLVDLVLRQETELPILLWFRLLVLVFYFLLEQFQSVFQRQQLGHGRVRGAGKAGHQLRRQGDGLAARQHARGRGGAARDRGRCHAHLHRLADGADLAAEVWLGRDRGPRLGALPGRLLGVRGCGHTGGLLRRGDGRVVAERRGDRIGHHGGGGGGRGGAGHRLAHGGGGGGEGGGHGGGGLDNAVTLGAVCITTARAGLHRVIFTVYIVTRVDNRKTFRKVCWQQKEEGVR